MSTSTATNRASAVGVCAAAAASAHRSRFGPVAPVGPASARALGPAARASVPASAHGITAAVEAGRRGNVRAAILALLTERPMHGYEMIQELDQRTGGVWRPSPGSVYPTLQLLEDEGLITSDEGAGRKAYTLTEAGQTEATAAAANPPWADFSEETVASGHDTREAIAVSPWRCVRSATSATGEQCNRAVEVLNDAKRKLYAILADAQ